MVEPAVPSASAMVRAAPTLADQTAHACAL